MSFIKFVCYKLIPFTLLFCFIALGVSVLFNAENATYLQTTTIGTTEIQSFNWQAYLNALTINRYEPIKDALDFSKIGKIFAASTTDVKWWQVIIALLQWVVNLWVTLCNLIITGWIRFVTATLQYILTIIGINMDADWWLANTFNWITHNLFIPTWGSIGNVTA